MEPNSTLKIGPHILKGRVVLAPMAGITDVPFRSLCWELGASGVTSEMVTSDFSLWHTQKSKKRLQISGQPSPRSVQILGTEPLLMAQSALLCADLGAEMIDINMGCPAKKVCRKVAGSALLQNTNLVAEILTAVVNAVDIPVTLKYRTGWDPEHKNAVTIAKVAESCGIQALTLHGRTRACSYKDAAEYVTIAEVAASVKISVIANGDITSAEKAKEILEQTGANAVMIGRSAQGRPWIFREISHFLDWGVKPAPPDMREIYSIIKKHLYLLYDFYGCGLGVRLARKHIGWYVASLPRGDRFREQFNQLSRPADQLTSAQDYFENLIDGEVMAT